MELSDKQYQELKFIKDRLLYSWRTNSYSLAFNTVIKVMEITYGKQWRDKVPSSFATCGTCKLREIKKIAQMIIDYEREHNKE